MTLYLLILLLQVLWYHGQSLKPGQTVWTVFGDLAVKNNAINLGQGYPDWAPPQFVTDSLRIVTDHQYTRPAGHPHLVNLIASRYSSHLKTPVNPNTEVAITVGASQALYLAFMTLLKPGDEVVTFDPFFELYQKQIVLTGAKPVYVPLGKSGEGISKCDQADPWSLDAEALEKSITPKTKILLINSPHNPTGKVFTSSELQQIAAIVRRHPNLVVISDEVYKYTIYDPLEVGDSTAEGHHHFAALPGMWDRTVTISSCGKTFSVTGWQIGWMVAPQKYIQPVHTILPCVQFCPPTPMQQALSYALVAADEPYEGYGNYYEWLRNQFTNKRNILQAGLSQIGIRSIQSNGGFFLLGELPEIDNKEIEAVLREKNQYEDDESYDWKYCRYMGWKYGVVAIPASPFFAQPGNMRPMARFAFCKKDETLLEVHHRLSKAKY